MKIPIKKTKHKEVFPWHQDFRNTESLPDIKVIRTQFFINFVAFILPLIVAVFWIQKEVALGTLRNDIASLNANKVSMEANNDDLVALSREFTKESAKIESLEEYYFNLFQVSEFLVALSKQVSEGMVLSSVDLKKGNRIDGNDVVNTWESKVAGYVDQGDTGAITAVNAFVENIGKDQLLTPFLDQAFLDNLSRDQVTDTLNFVVSITMSDTTKKAEDSKK